MHREARFISGEGMPMCESICVCICLCGCAYVYTNVCVCMHLCATVCVCVCVPCLHMCIRAYCDQVWSFLGAYMVNKRSVVSAFLGV